MASHGGTRAGAGRPEGGVSQAKRLLNRALMRGLEIAGRERGLVGDADEVATEAAARIASDLVLAGRGDEVLKLLAVAGVNDDKKPGEKSPLLHALERMPGMPAAQGAPITGQTFTQAPDPADIPATRPADNQSEAQTSAPFFALQRPLLPAELAPAQAPGGGGAPPLPAPAPHMGLRAENFEKTQNATEGGACG